MSRLIALLVIFYLVLAFIGCLDEQSYARQPLIQIPLPSGL